MGNVRSFCCRDDASDLDDREERHRILGRENDSAASDDLYDRSINSNRSNQDNLSYGSIGGNDSKTLEQSTLDKIYQKMATNLIDVAPGDSMVIQPAEFLERQKLYQAKLNQIKTPLPLRSSVSNRASKHINSSALDSTTGSSSSPLTGATSTYGSANQSKFNNSSNITSNYSTAVDSSANSSPAQQVNKSFQERRRTEYEPISSEDVELIKEISLKSMQAIQSLKISSMEPIITQFKP